MALQITALVVVILFCIYGVWRSCRDMAAKELAEKQAAADEANRKQWAWRANKETRWMD